MRGQRPILLDCDEDRGICQSQFSVGRRRPRSRKRKVVGRARQEVRKLVSKIGIGAPSLATPEVGIPIHRPRPRRQRHQLGDRTSAHQHPQMLTAFYPTKHGAHVVSKLTCRNIGHTQCSILLRCENRKVKWLRPSQVAGVLTSSAVAPLRYVPPHSYEHANQLLAQLIR